MCIATAPLLILYLDGSVSEVALQLWLLVLWCIEQRLLGGIGTLIFVRRDWYPQKSGIGTQQTAVG